MQLINHQFEKVLEGMPYGICLYAKQLLNPDQYEIHFMNQALADLLGIKDPMVVRFPKLYINGLKGDMANDYEAFETLLNSDSKDWFVYESVYLQASYMCYHFELNTDYHLAVIMSCQEEDPVSIQEEVMTFMVHLSQQLKEALVTYVERFNQVQSAATIGSFDYNTSTGHLWISDEMKRIFGVEGHDLEVLKTAITKIVHEEDVLRYRAFIENMATDTKATSMIRFKIIHGKSYELRYIECEVEPKRNMSGDLLSIRGIIRDYTDRELYEQMLVHKNENISNLYETLLDKQKLLEKQISETQFHKNNYYLSEEKYKTLVNSSQDVIYSCDLQGRIMAANARFCDLFHRGIEKVIGIHYKDLIQDTQRYNQWYDAFHQAIKDKALVAIEQSYKDGDDKRIYDMTFSPILDDMGQVIGITITKHNITLIRENEKQLAHLSMHDSLTDLPNRAALYDKLDHEINQDQGEMKAALLVIDVDNFKKINDTLGHTRGDVLLVAIAKRISSCLRGKDFIARLSGDEFAILLADIETAEDISVVVNRILKRVNETFLLEDERLDVTASIGIACYPEDGDTTEALMQSADTAMYRSKDASKNSFRFYNESMKEDLMTSIRYENRLKYAIDANELYLVYQPQFKADGCLRGFEALVRWENEDLGFVGPDQFIPVAEETGLIHNIGEWVADTAIMQCKAWQEAYDFQGVMAINISPVQLQRETFVDFIKETILEHQVGHQQIELEVTENLFIDNYDMAINVLDGLKSCGFRIALDDFGTGYSSLSYLKRLPINLLKIDKSFIREIDVAEPDGNITESIISLVHKLNIETIAEGVETAEQMDYLVRAKCDNLQGYHLGKPLSVEDASKLIETCSQLKNHLTD